MKKYILALAAATLALVACKPDNGDSTVNAGEIDYIEHQILAGSGAEAFVHHNYVLNFTSDASGKITGISEAHYIIFDPGQKPEAHSTASLTINYNGQSGTISRHSDGSDYEDLFVLNDDGSIKEFIQEKEYKSTYKYDNGYLTQILGHDQYSGMEITWSNGDLVKAGYSEIKYSSDPNPFAGTIDFTVSALNEWYPSPLYFYAAGLFGKHSAHLVKSTGDENYTTTYDYHKDKKGRIEKITLSTSYNGETTIGEQYLIHYK